MDNMKKLLQKISNYMVDLKKANAQNQDNNRGFVRKPFRIPYQRPQTQNPPILVEGLNSEEIYSIFRALTTGSQTALDDIKENHKET